MRRKLFRFSKRASEEDTLDVENAVNRMIERLLAAGQEKGTTQAELRTQLEALAKALQFNPEEAEEQIESLAAPPASGEIFMQLRPHPNYLTPKILINTIGSYLTALSQIQSVADEIKNAGSQPIGILNIVHGNPIKVMLLNGADAIDAVHDVIVPWLSDNTTQLEKIADSLQQSEYNNQTAERKKIELATEVITRLGQD